jgi:hypothetical protein
MYELKYLIVFKFFYHSVTLVEKISISFQFKFYSFLVSVEKITTNSKCKTCINALWYAWILNYNKIMAHACIVNGCLCMRKSLIAISSHRLKHRLWIDFMFLSERALGSNKFFSILDPIIKYSYFRLFILINIHES